MSEPSADPRLERARRLYVESDRPVKEILLQLGISLGALQNMARKNGWPRRTGCIVRRKSKSASAATVAVAVAAETRPTAVNTTRVASRKRRRPKISTFVDRLYRIINHKLELMETRMSDEENSGGDGTERDFRAVNNVVRSIEKLKEIEPEQSKRDGRSDAAGGFVSPEEEDRIRRKVIEHIIKLRERKRRDGGD